MNIQLEIKKYNLFRNLLILIFIIGVVLRFYHLGTKSINVDEEITLNEPFGQYAFWAGKSHMLYFTMVGFFLHFGKTEFWLRFVSALFGSLGVLAIYFAGKEIFNDKRVGILSALFIALSHIHLIYSQEARYYSVMFFLSTVSLYLFANFLQKGNIISLCLLPIICLANYLNHPTSIVFSGVLLAWIPFSIVITKNGREMLKNWWSFFYKLSHPQESSKKDKKQKDKKKARRRHTQGGVRDFLFYNFWGKLIIVSFVLVLSLIFILPASKIFKIIVSNINSIHFYKAPAAGVNASFKFFFYDHFIYYGPVVSPSILWQKYHVLLFIIFSLVGYLRALIKHFPFGSFFIFCLFITFTMLFSIPLTNLYANKYIFFIFPANVLCIMYGVITIIDFLSNFLIVRFKVNQLKALILIYAIFLIPELYKDLYLVKLFYRMEYINVKGAVRDLAPIFKPEDFVAAYGNTVGPASYYINYYGIPKSQFKKIPLEKGDGTRSFHSLLNLAESGGNVWYINGWPYDVRSYFKECIEKYFERTKKYPSTVNNIFDVFLWRWKYKDKMIQEGTSLTLNLALMPTTKSNPALSDKYLFGGETEIFATQDINASMESENLSNSTPSSFTLQIFNNNKKIAEIYKPEKEGNKDFAKNLDLSFGANKITFLIKNSSKMKQDIMNLKFNLKPTNPNLKVLYAVSYDSCTTSYDLECRTENNVSYLKMPYNGFTSYKIQAKETGNYLFGLQARNDAPGPIVYHIEVDDKPVGILSYPRADDSWELQQFPILLSKGERTISIYFISDTFGGQNATSADNDSFISSLRIEKLKGSEKFQDQRIPLQESQLVQISKNIPVKAFQLTSDGGWQAQGFVNPNNEKVYSEGKLYDGFQGDVPFDSKGASFLSPPIAVEPNKMLYFTIKGMVKDLGNHSANVMLVFLNKNGNIISQHWINAQGITNTANETKFICLRTSPPEAAFAIINLAVYMNSARPFSSTGKVWFFDFHSDVDLIK